MEDDNYQQQQDELCALEAIYADSFTRYGFWADAILLLDYRQILLKYQFQTTKDAPIWS